MRPGYRPSPFNPAIYDPESPITRQKELIFRPQVLQSRTEIEPNPSLLGRMPCCTKNLESDGNISGMNGSQTTESNMVGSTQISLPDLIEQHYIVLYKYAFRLSGSAADAEDLTQQTFLNAQLRMEQLRQPDHVRSWLFTILRNQFLKSVRRKPALPLTIEVPSSATDEPLGNDFEIDSEQLQAALDDLPEDFRIPIILYYFNEFSYRQIAEQLEIPIGTVMSRLSRGKRWLRDRLGSTVSMARQVQ